MAEALRHDVLEEGRTVWKISHAPRAAVLVDAADYFGALRAAMTAATRSITVVGWDIDSRTPLVGPVGQAEDDAPVTLLAFIESLVEKRPRLDVRLLLWDYTILYALDREPLPSLNLKWRTPEQVKVKLDSCLPLGACHHQKLVIVDGTLAFCGGLDLTTRRWDTPEHRPGHPFRRDADDKEYPPFHDVQMLVDGEAANRLAEIASRRWREATGEEIPAVNGEAGWPGHVVPDCEDVCVGIAQTLPATDDREAVTQVYELYLASIRTARRYVYIENQYLTSDEIAEALADRVREIPELEVLIVTPWAPEGWLEKRTMGAGQQRVMQKLSQEGLGHRVKFLYPWVGSGREHTPVMVHAKLMIVDDVLLRVGSSNLNNRSMKVDTECDLLLCASTEKHRSGIRSVMHRLLAEHLGLDTEVVADRLQSGSLLELAEAQWCDERGLKPLEQHEKYQTLSETLNLVADPEAPLEPSEFVGDMFGAAGVNRYATRRVLKLAAIAAMLLLVLLAWTYTPLADLADPEAVADALYGMRNEWWMYPATLAAFVLGGILLFPVTVMIAVTGMLFGPWTGWFYAMLGSMLSAWVGHATGLWLGGSPVRNVSGRAFRAVTQALKKQGVIAVAALRMVPVAPYTVVNMAMGAAGVPTRIFLAGSFLGMLPGTFVLTMLGDRLREAWREPGPANLILFVLVVVLWLGLAFVLQQLVSRLRKRGQ